MRFFQRLAANVTVTPLLHAVQRQPSLWNQHRLRTQHEGTAHAEADDIWLRFNEVTEQVVDDTECVCYPAWYQLPQAHQVIFDLMHMVHGVRLGRVIITRLAPGASIKPHADGGAPATYYDRYQCMLQCLPGVRFDAGGEVLEAASGDVFWFDNEQKHSVVNNSADDRVAMIMDIRCVR